MSIQEPIELSERELDILKLVATGASNKEIAQKLFISSNTVKVHLRNIFTKIGANSRTEAAMYAVRNGVVDTASARVLDNGTTFQNLENTELALPPVAVQEKKSYFRYVGLYMVVFLSLAILGLVFFRDKIIPSQANIPPTATERVRWFELPGLPTPRTGLALANYENQIYAIGGKGVSGVSNVLEMYDPPSSTWMELASKPTRVMDIGAAAIGGLIYVPGGKLSSGLTTDVNEIYDPRSDQWTEGSPLPKPLSSYALAVYEGRMYVFGGWDGHQVANDAFVYDPRIDTWTPILSMPTARSQAGAVAVGGKIYVIGGWDGQNALTVNEVYQPDGSNLQSKWTETSPLPVGRYGMGITNLADIIFIIGGITSDQGLKMIALPQDDKKWGQIEAPLQNDWSFLGAVTVGTRLYAVGGQTGEGLSNQMWSYQAIFTITLPIVR